MKMRKFPKGQMLEIKIHQIKCHAKAKWEAEYLGKMCGRVTNKKKSSWLQPGGQYTEVMCADNKRKTFGIRKCNQHKYIRGFPSFAN